MFIDLFARGLIVMIFLSGSAAISYYITRFIAFIIPVSAVGDIFLWTGTVVLTTFLLMGSAYAYVYHGFGAQADIIRRNTGVGNKVVLTFDDGPGKDYTPTILDILADKGAKATFFMVGKQVEKHPEIVRRIVDEGHEVGNHTYGHITVPHAPPPQLAAQIMRTNLVILQHTGVYPQYLRPPRGLYDMRLRRIAKLLGQELVLWSLSSQDWHPRATAAGVSRRIINKVLPGDIILFHDSGSLLGNEGSNRRPTVEALGPIIDGIRAKGLQIVAMEEFMIHPGVPT